MAKGKSQQNSNETVRRRPATTPEARENQLIAMAFDLVEQRLRDGTATSQETTHFLKLGSEKERLERDILKQQRDLMEAKAEALRSAKRVEELYADAITAFKRYSGQIDSDEQGGDQE